jgi:hypothetical protein
MNFYVYYIFQIPPLHVSALRPSSGQLMSTWKEMLYILPLVGHVSKFLV